MKYRLYINKPFMGLSTTHLYPDVEGDTEQDALENWRMHHPQYWNNNDVLDVKNRTFDGHPIFFESTSQ